MKQPTIKLIECPRDAMQGWKNFIPTEKKIQYINSLLKVGFDTIDFGSFVSAKAIPQMADTKHVISKLDPIAIGLESSTSKLLAIVANTRGAEEASEFDQITYLGFPFSVSETFQQRNTNSSIQQSLKTVEEIQNICINRNKQLVIYISMGFGNPYGDPYSDQIVFDWVSKMVDIGVRIISLADTVGLATDYQIHDIVSYLVEAVPDIEIGVHLHSKPDNWENKLSNAVHAGCRRFDGALKGIGGCPMANDELVGNMNTELMINYFKSNYFLIDLNEDALAESIELASEIFV
jgi:hydroxymethylglutaryl-CoA lyase